MASLLVDRPSILLLKVYISFHLLFFIETLYIISFKTFKVGKTVCLSFFLFLMPSFEWLIITFSWMRNLWLKPPSEEENGELMHWILIIGRSQSLCIAQNYQLIEDEVFGWRLSHDNNARNAYGWRWALWICLKIVHLNHPILWVLLWRSSAEFDLS